MKRSKPILIYFFVLSLAFAFGCRKKDDLGYTLAEKPLHCYNGVQDADETLVDYGGSCQITPIVLSSSCGQANNTVTIGTTTTTVTSCKKTVSGSYFVFTLLLSDGGKIVITTSDSVNYNSPLKYTYISPYADEFIGKVTPSGSPTYDLSYGEVQIKMTGSIQAVEICNGFIGGFNGIPVTGFAFVN